MCQTAFDYSLEFNSTEKILLSFNTLVATINLITNILVIILIYTTNQLKNQSLKLTFILSTSDVFLSVVSQQVINYFLVANSTNCYIKVTAQFWFYFFPYLSAFIIALIVYDRYIRMLRLTEYSKYMTKKRFNAGILIVFMLTFLQLIPVTVASTYDIYTFGTIAMLPINLIVMALEIYWYTKTILILREHKKQRRKNLRQIDVSLARLAAVYMMMIIVFYAPYVITNGFMFFLPRDSSWSSWIMASQLLACCNSSANAISFLRVNRKARKKLRNIFYNGRIRNTSNASGSDEKTYNSKHGRDPPQC